MGFWSKIGLADKTCMLELKTEIIKTRDENCFIIEQNRKLLEELVILKAKESIDGIERYRADNRGSSNEIMSLIRKTDDLLISGQVFLNESIDGLDKEIHNLSNQIKDIEICINKMISNSEKIDNVVIENQVAILRNEKTLNLLKEDTQNIVKNSCELENISSEISELRESINNLWTIMKVVWIDSLLEELDKAL